MRDEYSDGQFPSRRSERRRDLSESGYREEPRYSRYADQEEYYRQEEYRPARETVRKPSAQRPRRSKRVAVGILAAILLLGGVGGIVWAVSSPKQEPVIGEANHIAKHILTRATAILFPGEYVDSTGVSDPYKDAITIEAEFPFKIYISKETYTITALGMDNNGEYTKELHSWSTAIGKTSAQTRSGVYKTIQKEYWHEWLAAEYSVYVTYYDGWVWIHSPVFVTKDTNTMKKGSYNNIGTNATSGCLRTTSEAAAWFYYNCPIGSPVEVVDGGTYSAPKPDPLPEDQTYDPTDPKDNPEIIVTKFDLNAEEHEMKVGDTFTITTSNVLPAEVEDAKFVYYTSDPNVATVDENGVVTAVGRGKVAITVSADDVYGMSRKCIIDIPE